MKLASGTPTGSDGRERDGGLEDRDGVVGEGADGAAGEARHPLGRLGAPTREEVAERRERVVGREHR